VGLTSPQRTPHGIPTGGQFTNRTHPVDTITLDNSSPTNTGWTWTTNDSTEFARRHLNQVAANIYWADKNVDKEQALRQLGEAAAHAEFAASILADEHEPTTMFGYTAADMVESERARPGIAQRGVIMAPAMSAERRTQLIQHFVSRFAAVAALKATSTTSVPAAEGAMDGYWAALHLMDPNRFPSSFASR
jgi:hypothetical protein